MIGEQDVAVPVMQILDESLLGELTTTEVREEVKRRVKLDQTDLQPLENRNDFRIDQIVRNLKSHKKTPGNPIFEGLMEDVPRGFRITERGRRYLRANR
ncbi:MAG: hypothetical protein AAF754_11880 [Pseudomonadota bacterium]